MSGENTAEAVRVGRFVKARLAAYLTTENRRREKRGEPKLTMRAAAGLAITAWLQAQGASA